MKFHACHFRGLLSGHDKGLIVGMAGGRVSYQPQARWLYSLRFYLLLFSIEVLWITGKRVRVLYQDPYTQT